MTDEVPFIRKEFSDLVARRIYPSMKRMGLRRQGKRLWYEQRPDSSWVLVEIQVSDHTTRTTIEYTVNTVVWPPGTWAEMQQRHPVWAAQPMPHATWGAPIFGRPGAVRPDLWPQQDFVAVSLDDDVAAAVDELHTFLLAALQWGRTQIEQWRA